MRYSMLVYLTEMGRTLLEAAEYLAASPAEDPVRGELLENGLRMMDQIHGELEQHGQDLRSSRPLDLLNKAKENWGGGESAAPIRQWVQCLSGEVRYQVRAVFLADLGEKWDSMESVYRFMRDDPRFDPVVVLIPYIRLDPETPEKQPEVIYDDYFTPMGIPFVAFDQYSLKEDRPELAFISQPYKAVLPPEFYPEYISQYSRLVYLPYFLPYQVRIEANAGSLARLPIYNYAWKVICSTEKHYDFYCRYSVHHGANALLTGIPKLDGLAELPDRGIERPKGWEVLEGKTVFLWNSWFDIAFSSFRYFDALLDWFERRPDCVLLWRMHPLTDATTKVQRTDMYQDFLKKVQRAEAVSNVVIDREASFYAAFYYSDAMISDPSSMLPQYLLMDKPTLLIRMLGYYYSDEFVGSAWMDKAENASDIFSFLERICTGADKNAELRKTIRQRDLPLADGRSAERICEALWTDLHRETLG